MERSEHFLLNSSVRRISYDEINYVEISYIEISYLVFVLFLVNVLVYLY